MSSGVDRARGTRPPRRPLRAMRGAVVAALLLMTGAPGAVSADSIDRPASSSPDAIERAVIPSAGGPIAKQRVSTSPDVPGSASNVRVASTAVPATAPGQPMRVRDDSLPLTRAATRQRVESMSPRRWLLHYGDVRVHDRP